MQDSRYYEAMFESMFPFLKNITQQDIEKEIQDTIKTLQEDFKKLEADYEIRGSYVRIYIKRINTYNFNWNFECDLNYMSLKEKGQFTYMIYPKIKHAILGYWDNKILK